LLHSLFCQAEAIHRGSAYALVSTVRPQYKAAFRRERSRKGEQFNPEQYLIAKEIATLNLPKITLDAVPNSADFPQLCDVSKDRTSFADKARYLAARFGQHDQLAASHNFQVDSKSVNELESLFEGIHTDTLFKRHQAKVSSTGKKAELKYLKSAEGLLLLRKLIRSDRANLEALSESLSPKRTYLAIAPSLVSLREKLQKHLSCLPKQMGILIQFGSDRFTAADLESIRKTSPRLHIGPIDPDLGARPRFSIVDAQEPMNFVRRARWTSVTRCLITALLLIS
jgi:hypothetical protein